MFMMILTVGVGTAVTLAFAVPAYAFNARTWIASAGIDQPGCGPIASPCRTLQYGHDQTSESGEIDVKDAAGYGPIVISKSISIINDGALAGVLAPPDGVGITITSGAANVTLRGLTIDGAGTGANGIAYSGGARSI